MSKGVETSVLFLLCAGSARSKRKKPGFFNRYLESKGDHALEIPCTGGRLRGDERQRDLACRTFYASLWSLREEGVLGLEENYPGDKLVRFGSPPADTVVVTLKKKSAKHSSVEGRILEVLRANGGEGGLDLRSVAVGAFGMQHAFHQVITTCVHAGVDAGLFVPAEEGDPGAVAMGTTFLDPDGPFAMKGRWMTGNCEQIERLLPEAEDLGARYDAYRGEERALHKAINLVVDDAWPLPESPLGN